MRVHEAKEGKKAQGKPRPYEPRKDQGRGRARQSNAPPRFDFVVELAELIAIPAIAARLRAPEKTDKVLGRKKNVWCEFHQAYGHSLHTCLALGHQLAELVKSGFLSDYLRKIRSTRYRCTGRCTRSREASLEEGVRPLRGKGTRAR